MDGRGWHRDIGADISGSTADVGRSGTQEQRGRCPHQEGAPRAIHVLRRPATAGCAESHRGGEVCARRAEGRRHQVGDKRRWAVSRRT